MKKNILIILIAGLMVFGSSCSKDFLTVNEKNPNSPSAVPAYLVLPAGINAVATTMNLPGRFDFVYLWYGQWSLGSNWSPNVVYTQYRISNTDFQNGFIAFYIAAGNLDVVEKSATDPKDVYFMAIAKIMKAYVFQNLVDIWGDVPYTEAFQTAAGNLKPKYHNQKAIYEDLVVQLDAAMAAIQAADPALVNSVPAGSDLMLGGKMALWLKFANTLKLRILIHQADMADRTAYITGKIATTASIGYLGAGESALVNPGYLISAGKMNPFYETFYNSAAAPQAQGTTYYYAGKDAVDYLKATNDPRLAKFYLPYSGTSYSGNIMGTIDLPSTKVTSQLGYSKTDANTMIGSPTKSSPVLTDFESLFIQAEAAERGLIAGDPQALYESAVAQSFIYMGLSTAAAVTYVAQPTVSYTNTLKTRELILTQKWIALNGIAPIEIWTDYRRTGYPYSMISATGMHFSPNTLAKSEFPPVRLLYPQDEVSLNGDNYAAALKAQNWVDEFKTKIFWQNR